MVLCSSRCDGALPRNPYGQVVLASPSTSIPRDLLEGAPSLGADADRDPRHHCDRQSETFCGRTKSSASRRSGDFSLWLMEAPELVGTFDSSFPQEQEAFAGLLLRRWAASTPGRSCTCSVPSDLRGRLQIHGALGDVASVGDDPEIVALRRPRRTHHPSKIRPAQALERGVAFHYGSMPQSRPSRDRADCFERKLRTSWCARPLCSRASTCPAGCWCCGLEKAQRAR